MGVRPGETDPSKKPVISYPCLLKGDITKVKIVDMAAGALHALLLSGTVLLFDHQFFFHFMERVLGILGQRVKEAEEA
jgi:hypothetical protein